MARSNGGSGEKIEETEVSGSDSNSKHCVESGTMVYVFEVGPGSRVGGVFSSRAEAVEWIRRHKLSGTLLMYAIDEPPYERAQRIGKWRPTKPVHYTAKFITKFSPPDPHEHFAIGVSEKESGYAEAEEMLENLDSSEPSPKNDAD